MNISNKELLRRLRRVESRNVTFSAEGFPVFWDRARGCRVWDVEGRRYLDLTAAFGVSSLGHADPAIARAIRKQSARFWHGMGDIHPSRSKVELLEALAEVAPRGLTRTVLGSSGAEAVEAALKTARLCTGKPGVLSFDGAYHGLTYGALAATHGREFRDPFADQLGDFVAHVPYPDPLHGVSETLSLQAVQEVLRRTPRIGAVLVEPMQARGGVRIPSPAFLQSLANLARKSGVLLIADEIYTGFGRTGRFFAVEHSGVVPDLLCVGKALANGYPLSACIGRKDVMDAWPPSDGEAIHTSTFLGNPLGCAMGVAAIRETVRRRLPERAADTGTAWLNALRDALQGAPGVAEIRGIGLMIGIELSQDASGSRPDPARAGRIIRTLLSRGVIALSGGAGRNVLALTPALTIPPVEWREATRLIKEAIYGTPVTAS